jgi:hypothetical protein
MRSLSYNCSLQRLGRSVALSILLISAHGCMKSSDGVPVRGHVSYRGDPLASAGITFFPANGRPVTAAVTQGDYAIEVVPGDYTVVVNVGSELPPGYKEGDPVQPPKVVLPDEYSERAKSTLKASVKAGQSEPIDFNLK